MVAGEGGALPSWARPALQWWVGGSLVKATAEPPEHVSGLQWGCVQ